MIQVAQDLEGFLGRLERPFERAASGTYVLRMGAGGALVALRLEPPVLVIRAEIGRVPSGADASRSLYKKLLELNASALVHASFGLEGDQIVLAAALELTSLDLNELEAVLSDIDLALAEHVSTLHELVKS
ncbi:MAG: CesT family type III secretion system chaperone [Myxococcota bacterium]